MRKLAFQAIVITVLCWAVFSYAGDQVFIKSEAIVDFTPNTKHDIYEITVKGTNLSDYVITYRILTFDKIELYKFTSKYSKVHVDPPGRCPCKLLK